MTVTRRRLRRWIASEIGELLHVVVTANANSADTVTSDTHLVIPDNELVGREAWYTRSGNSASLPNLESRRVVVANSEVDASLTVRPAWPAPPRAGDRVDLFNARGYSVTIPEIHRKINQLITEVAAEAATVEKTDPVTFSALTPIVDYPNTWVWLFGAEYQDLNGVWHTIPAADILLRTWDTNVEIRFGSLRQCHGRPVRLVGGDALHTIHQDDQTTDVDPSWLVKQAVAELRKATALRWGDAATALALHTAELAEAEKRRPAVPTVFPALGRKWRLRRPVVDEADEDDDE